MSIQKVRAAPASDTEKRPIGKTDHVKTSPQRQVKVRSFHFCFLFFFLLSSQQMSAAEAVDLIFVNGNIYTVDEKRPHAEAIAVKGGRIAFVGSNEDAKKFQVRRVVDLGGKTVVPGLTETSLLPLAADAAEIWLDLLVERILASAFTR